MENIFLQGLAFALPALVTGIVAYLILSKFIDQNNNDKKIDSLITKKKESLPIKLQAYERLILLCERINPCKLIVRINPLVEDTKTYYNMLIDNIQQEFEHNIVQQIYVSDDCWKAVVTSKISIINTITKLSEKAKNSKDLYEEIIYTYSKKENPTDISISIIKNEAKKLL